MAYILHIDTSGDSGLIAISQDGVLLAKKINKEIRNHAATINTDIQSVLKIVSIKFKDIDAIAVCAGPGSYTGLRIGVSTAKGICYAIDKPLLMHNKLTLFGHHAFLTQKVDSDYILPILLARENEYYIALYDKTFKEIIAPKHIYKEDLSILVNKYENILFTGRNKDIAQKEKIELAQSIYEQHDIDINSWSHLASEEYKSNTFVNLANCEPDYLKKVYTHKPKSSN